jgi:hypothetical protein
LRTVRRHLLTSHLPESYPYPLLFHTLLSSSLLLGLAAAGAVAVAVYESIINSPLQPHAAVRLWELAPAARIGAGDLLDGSEFAAPEVATQRHCAALPLLEPHTILPHQSAVRASCAADAARLPSCPARVSLTNPVYVRPLHNHNLPLVPVAFDLGN